MKRVGGRTLGAILAAFVAAGGVSAQGLDPLGADKAALRDEQKQIFAQMFERPDDLDLMFQYALISIQLEDLEAAISTLERMLIYNKDLPRVHMELGAAYYRLGSYKTASYYFNNVLAFGDVPPQVRDKTEEFLRAIDQRTQKSVFTGSASSGIVYASNATLGPDDPTVQLFGQSAVLGAQFLEGDDFGSLISASISNFYDLGQPDSDFWRTDFSFYTLNYFDKRQNDLDSTFLRTGPQISLNDQQFGPKLRPFAEFDYVRSGNIGLYATASLGAEYTDTLSDTFSIYGSLRGGYRNYVDGVDVNGDGDDDLDGPIFRATAGAAYIPSDALIIRGALFAERFLADEDANATTELTARASATYAYDSGVDFAGRLWTLTGFGQATYRNFDDANVQLVGAAGTKEREDVDLRVGLRHTFYLEDGFWIAADADYLYRDSNFSNFEIDNFGAGLSVGFDF